MFQGLKPSNEWAEYLEEFSQLPIVEYITMFKTELYIMNPGYLIESVKAGKLLDV